jgi:hypothetical protein
MHFNVHNSSQLEPKIILQTLMILPLRHGGSHQESKIGVEVLELLWEAKGGKKFVDLNHIEIQMIKTDSNTRLLCFWGNTLNTCSYHAYS